ncbi:hypothetical protein CI594_01380 [Fischerella thermalis CCMEE 5196]|nr:hypothetical protein CI594_01380 [Fischerella thermalis CCMEE 5196]
MIRWFAVSFLLLAIVSSLTTALSARGAFYSNLIVTINGVKTQQGQVCLSLFATRKGFPDSKKQAVQARCVKVAETPLLVKFQNLRAGNYAVAVFHDVNNDNRLNRNVLGIPTEQFGFSQNPTIIAGPPTFGDSQVLVIGSETNIQITLRSL